MSFNLEAEITKALSTFNEDVSKEIEESVDNLADKTASKLRGASPVLTGEYANDWDVKRDKRGRRIIYQKRRIQNCTFARVWTC